MATFLILRSDENSCVLGRRWGKCLRYSSGWRPWALNGYSCYHVCQFETTGNTGLTHNWITWPNYFNRTRMQFNLCSVWSIHWPSDGYRAPQSQFICTVIKLGQYCCEFLSFIAHLGNLSGSMTTCRREGVEPSVKSANITSLCFLTACTHPYTCTDINCVGRVK